MSNPLINYNEVNNFWKVNPQYLVIQPFKSFYKEDKTKDKKYSSDIMWSISLIFHPESELYYTVEKEEKILTEKLKVKKKDVDKFLEDYKYIIDPFIDMSLTQGQKSLVSWEKRMKQRDEFLASQHYHFGYVEGDIEYRDNTKALDDMNSKTGKFYEEYFKIQKDLSAEKLKENKKGYNASDVNI